MGLYESILLWGNELNHFSFSSCIQYAEYVMRNSQYIAAWFVDVYLTNFLLLLMLRLLSMKNVHEALLCSLLDIENNMYDVKLIILIYGYPHFIIMWSIGSNG